MIMTFWTGFFIGGFVGVFLATIGFIVVGCRGKIDVG
jgi:hypothetical protein